MAHLMQRGEFVRIEVRYPRPGQYELLIGDRDDEDAFMIQTLSSAAEVKAAIRGVAERVGWDQLRLPLLLDERPGALTPIPEDLRTALIEILREREAKTRPSR